MIDTYCICCINYPITIQKSGRSGFSVPKYYLKQCMNMIKSIFGIMYSISKTLEWL